MASKNGNRLTDITIRGERLNMLPKLPILDTVELQGNLKDLSQTNYEKLVKTHLKHGIFLPFYVWESPEGINYIADGHQRRRVLPAEGYTGNVPVVYIEAANMQEAKEKLLVISSQYGKITQDGYDEFTFDLPDVGEMVNFDALNFEFGGDEDEGAEDGGIPISLTDRFLVPPFSVLDARQGYWQERKKAWLSLGIQGEVGRKENALGMNMDIQPAGLSATSVFDPVICELAYTWFTSPGANVLDPFAGGSVRGVVASYLGRHYTGIDLRREQITENIKQGLAIVPDCQPTWKVGDSREIDNILAREDMFDFIFSCPPYADLEVYSDDPRDISTMGYQDFIKAYREIIRLSVSRLRPNRFACFVVGDVRDSRGNYYNFVGDTIGAFLDAGCRYYNEAVLVTMLGNLQIRVVKIFESGRKLGKAHQNVLVFVKGDSKKAAQWCGPVEVANSIMP